MSPYEEPEWHRKMQYQHNLVCYGKGDCFSCGCHKPSKIVCYSHEGGAKHQAQLLERIAIAQERLANVNV